MGLFRVELNSFEADKLGATRFAAAAESVVSFVRDFGYETVHNVPDMLKHKMPEKPCDELDLLKCRVKIVSFFTVLTVL